MEKNQKNERKLRPPNSLVPNYIISESSSDFTASEGDPDYNGNGSMEREEEKRSGEYFTATGSTLSSCHDEQSRDWPLPFPTQIPEKSSEEVEKDEAPVEGEAPVESGQGAAGVALLAVEDEAAGDDLDYLSSLEPDPNAEVEVPSKEALRFLDLDHDALLTGRNLTKNTLNVISNAHAS